MSDYNSKAIVTEISATSRVAIKVRDNFYTVEYSEKRAIPDVEGIDIEAERVALFDAVNGIVDAQADDILRTFQPNRK